MAGPIKAQDIIRDITVTLTTNLAARAVIKSTKNHAFGRQDKMDSPLPIFFTKTDNVLEEQKSSILHAYKQTQATSINDRYYYDLEDQGRYVVLYPRYFVGCPVMADVHWKNADIV